MLVAFKARAKNIGLRLQFRASPGNTRNKSHHSQPMAAGTPLRGARVLNVTRAVKAKRSPSVETRQIFVGYFYG